MAPTSMEVKVISCKDIKAFNFFQKLSIYATISIVSQDPNNNQTTTTTQQQQKTPIDREGDGNPEWNHHTQFDLNQISSDLDHLFLQFDLLSEGTILGDKTVGQVRVPIKDLIEECNGVVRFVSYQVMTTDGKPNGVLDFSCKVIDDQISYPVIESFMYPPLAVAPEVYYPTTQEVYYSPPPQNPHFPMMEAVYYPPPQPPVVYPVPTIPYGLEEYGCPACPYPTVDPFRPYGEDTWRKDSQCRGEFDDGYWDVSQIRNPHQRIADPVLRCTRFRY